MAVPDVEDGPREVDRLRDELAAERAGAAHWRDVARRREQALADLKGRTSVRALLSVERRSAPLRASALRGAATARRKADALRLAASAVATADELPARRRRLEEAVASADRRQASREPGGETGEAELGDRSILLIVWGDGSPAATSPPPSASRLRVETAADDAAIASLVGSADEDLVGLLAATTEPLTAATWERLARCVIDGAAAATGVLVHPERGRNRATPHDLLVRSAGMSVELTSDGTPQLIARSAGAEVPTRDAATDGTGGPVTVDAASAALVLLDRAAVVGAGGYLALGDPDASLADLCFRLGGHGAVVSTADALALDHRPVTGRAALRIPLDESGSPWRSLMERQGPAMRRSTPGVDREHLDIVLTVASPMRKVADRWGDWHLAEGLARALSARGHRVHVQTLDEVGSPRSLCADVHLVLRGLARVARSPGQAHLLWVISHPEDLDDHEIDAADLVLVASSRFADDLRRRTTTPVEVLLQATDAERFRPLPPDPAHRHEVVVVGKSRDVMRPMVRDAIAAGLRPAIHGSGWEDLVDAGLVVSDHVDNHDLPRVYSSAGVVLNDHWDTMRTWGFVSNRVFDVLACGTPVVSDPVPGLTEAVGDLVTTWTDPDELKAAVSAALEVDREAFAQRARALVTGRHTFSHRAEELEQALARWSLPRSAP